MAIRDRPAIRGAECNPMVASRPTTYRACSTETRTSFSQLSQTSHTCQSPYALPARVADTRRVARAPTRAMTIMSSEFNRPSSRARRGRRTRLLAAAGAACAIALGASGFATAAPALASAETVLQDDAVLLHSDDAGVLQAMQELKQLGVDRVRVTAGWSVLAPNADSPTPPAGFDGTDPAAYPPLIWRNLDRTVRDAHAVGLKLDIDIAFWAPRWATKDPASTPDRLATDIDPQLYAQFATAIARRYSGSYTPPAPPTPQTTQPSPGPQPQSSPPPQSSPSPDANVMNNMLGLFHGRAVKMNSASSKAWPRVRRHRKRGHHHYGANDEAGPLPAVDMFTIWNEPNQPGFLKPQWTMENGAWVASSADVYRALVQAAYPAIKAAAPNAKVLIGATASMGSNHPGQGSVAPLAFLRQLACVDRNLTPITTGACANFTPLPGDGWSHHPYSLLWRPDWVPHNPDMAPIGATSRLTSMLRTLVREGRIAPAAANVYMTEYGYGTNPPDPESPFGLSDQVKNLAWAENIALRDPAVKMWPQFLLRDRPDGPAGPQMRMFGDWHTGLFFNDGTPKPSATTFRVPSFAQCVTSGKRNFTMIWGRLRGANAASASVVQATTDGHAWTAAHTASSTSRHAATASQAPAPDGIVTRYVPYSPHVSYRLVWNDPGDGTFTGVAVKPLPCTASAKLRRRARAHH
jgi:hypothetical protein